MKRRLFTIIVFCFFLSQINAQSKIEIGLTTEGSWFFPEIYSQYSPPNKNGFGVGIGVYASRSIFEKISADIGISYRFKEMEEFYDISPNPSGSYGGYGGYSPYGNYGGYGNYDYGSNYSYDIQPKGWEKYSLHYIVVPVHLNFLIHKNIFFRGGIEASWLTNFDTGNDETEFNWTIGFGSKRHKIKWSVNYIRGFKEAVFANNLYAIDGIRSATLYNNNMLQLSLSYPFWHKK